MGVHGGNGGRNLDTAALFPCFSGGRDPTTLTPCCPSSFSGWLWPLSLLPCWPSALCRCQVARIQRHRPLPSLHGEGGPPDACDQPGGAHYGCHRRQVHRGEWGRGFPGEGSLRPRHRGRPRQRGRSCARVGDFLCQLTRTSHAITVAVTAVLIRASILDDPCRTSLPWPP